MKKVIRYLALTAFCILLFSCMREPIGGSYGKEVLFNLNSKVTHITKTSYSGVLTTSDVERIDWEDGDLIRIISNEVSEPVDKYADYVLSLTGNNGRYSYAKANPASSSGHGLIWGEGSHTFYSVYPSPSTSGAQSGLGLSLSDDGGLVTAVIPVDQSYATARTGVTEDYYGDMRLAYMTAATTASEGSDVTLEFTPMVTTFYVTVSNDTGATMTLRKVSLSSGDTALAGTFRAVLSSSNTRTYSVYEGGGWVSAPTNTASNSTVYATFDGLSIAPNGSITVALFAMPVENIKQLTLSVVTDETGELCLPLKYEGSWINFAREHKHNLNNLGLPPVSYTLEVDKSTLEYDRSGVAGTDQQFTVTSTKTIGPNTRPASWKTQIKNSSDQWVDLEGNCPAWLADFPLNSTGITTNSQLYQEDVTAQPVVSHEDRLKSNKVYDASGAVYDNSTKANALDLSKYNFISRRQETLRTTANTYIVAAPGWYKIPMVYGNLIENGSTVANACKGSRWALGHLDYFKKSTDANIYLGVNYPWLQSAYLDHCQIHWEKYTHWNGSASETTGRQWSSGSDIGVVTDLELNTSEEYMYFYVDPDMIRPGNVLLATYGDNDDCCWSWQIWITDQNMSPITVGDNQVLPVNLGWIDDTEGQFYPERSSVLKFVSTEADNLESDEMTVIQPEFERVSTSGWQTYYQWGRKDPFSPGVMNVYNDDGTLNRSILHPSNIMYDESTSGSDEYYDWTSANYNNLWDSQNNSWATPSDQLPNHKTVYDPSPRGFSAPPDAAWDSFSSNGYEKWENGLFFYTSASRNETIFFPASGYINYNATIISDGGTGGYYWTIRPGQNTQKRASYCLRFLRDGLGSVSAVYKDYDATSPFTTMAYRALAYSVRPVMFNSSAQASDVIEGEQMQEITFSEYLPANSNDLNGASITAGDVTVSFVRPSGIQHPSYDLSTGLVSLPDSGINDNMVTKMIVSIPSGNIIKIELVFDSSDGGSPAITASSSPEDGGGYADGRGDQGRYGVWNITGHSGGVFTPDANTVTFRTATTVTSRNRYLYGMYVYYKPSNP